jgi:DNA adenine methylase
MHQRRNENKDKNAIEPINPFGVKSPPLIKWPGGKRILLPHLIPLLPRSFGTYYEPFFGGGALFFATQPARATLSDTNGDLINVYVQVRDECDRLIRILKQYKNSKAAYYGIREYAPTSALNRAARLVYLVTLSFNGIHRVNLRGDFNVPYGYKTHLVTCDEDRVRATSEALASAILRVGDFEEVTSTAKKGDMIYFDPPYTVAHAHNGFVKYNEKIFSWDDQIRLAKHALSLSRRGCHVLVSNASHESVRNLYNGFCRKEIERFSAIAAAGQFRKRITETIYYLVGG